MGRKPSVPSTTIKKEWSRPKLLDVENQEKGMHYRWVRKKDVGARRTMGYVMADDANLQAVNLDGSSTPNTHDLILMKISKAKVEEIREYQAERAKKMATTIRSKEGSKAAYENSLKELGGGGRVSGIKTVATFTEGAESLGETTENTDD